MSIIRPRPFLLSLLVLLVSVIGIAVLAQSAAVGELWSGILLDIQAIQRQLHRELVEALRHVTDEGPKAAWGLIFLSFMYGVFHAAGPGHGKVVISTYLLTQESQLRRGLLLSLVASLCQGLTAVLAVSGAVGLFNLSMRDARGATSNLETLSYGLVALVGLTLVASRAYRLWSRRQQSTAYRDPNPEHIHSATHRHDHDRACSSCGHAHGPSLDDLEAPLSWKGLVGMVASIGLRPCSGAVLVLLVSYPLNLQWAGIAAVFAMSLGTAITVSILAGLAVYARKLSLRLAALLPDSTSRLTTATDLVGLIGGAVILIIGLLLFQASWTAPAHPLR